MGWAARANHSAEKAKRCGYRRGVARPRRERPRPILDPLLTAMLFVLGRRKKT